MIKFLRCFLHCVSKCWITSLIGLILFICIFSSFKWLVYAEGSRTLFPSGITGNRANIEWRNSFFGDNFLRRRTLLKVYAEVGEVILVGSSSVGVDNGDIQIYNPGIVTGPVGNETIPDIPNFSCKAQREATANLNQGYIISRAQELAGPDTITDMITATPGLDVPSGYTPCFYIAPTTGIYDVVFFGPKGDNSDDETSPTGEIDLTNPDNFNTNQDTSVAAWDVTVRSTLTSTVDITGRLFTNYLAMSAGTNSQPINSTFYVLTKDGYIYRIDLRGLDPNELIIYANDVGFLDSDDAPLYHDLVADTDRLNEPHGSTSLAPPTHLLFFELPSDEVILANNITLVAPDPLLDSLIFNANLGNNNTSFGAGDIFTYTSNVIGTYELIISRDGVNFDPDNPLNRVLRGVRSAGVQNIMWDGLDNVGNPFFGGVYSASITIHAGEFHLPLLDVENSLNGGPQITLLNPPTGTCPSFHGGPPNCNVAFYDDRGYTTANSIEVGLTESVLSGNGSPTSDHSDPLAGFDTTTEQRHYGDGTEDGFGDKKGLDLWTYVPSETRIITFDIRAPNLVIDTTDGGITAIPGGIVTYNLTYTNTGTQDATGVVITETVPTNTTFNASASAPTVWNCPDGSSAGTICITNIGLLASNASGSVNFSVTIDEFLPPGIISFNNEAVIGDDGMNGPEPIEDNIDIDETIINQAVCRIPDVTKIADRVEAPPGTPLNFLITISNPLTLSTSLPLIVYDLLPQQLDLITYTISSTPPDLVNTVIVTGQLVSISIPVLQANEKITLTLGTRVKNLVNSTTTIRNRVGLTRNPSLPLPLECVSFFMPGGKPTNFFPETGIVQVSIPVPDEPREDTPIDLPSPSDDELPPLNLPAPEPTLESQAVPLLPVTYLPETGLKKSLQTRNIAISIGLLAAILFGVGLIAGLKHHGY